MLKTILVANVGSTSFKYQLYTFQGMVELARGKVERIHSNEAVLTHLPVSAAAQREEYRQELGWCDYSRAIRMSLDMLLEKESGAIESLDQIAAIGFKTVHAGPVSGAVLVDERVLQSMDEYAAVVPAHNRPYIDAIRLFQELLPATPLAAVFETAFHRDIPDYAHTYSLPYEWYEKYNIRRYGFHGASHRYVTEKAAEVLNRAPNELKMISCHLGGSSSVCAVRDGSSIDTSMGFSAQSGLPMSTRNGDIDPYIIFFLTERHGLTLEEIRQAMVMDSGLKGISGLSGDIRDLEKESSVNQRARLALNVFTYEVKKYIGAYAAALGGLDALIFTGGIGENGMNIRRDICTGLEFMGIKLDAKRNQVQEKIACISAPDAKVPVLVIPTNEGLIVARETINALNGA